MSVAIWTRPSRARLGRRLGPRWIGGLRWLLVGLLVPAMVAGSALSDVLAAARQPIASPPAAPQVKVNRTLPRVRPVPSYPVFSAQPTVEELFRARLFDEPLVAAGDAASAAEAKALAKTVETYLHGRDAEDVSAFADYLAAFPESPWRVSLLTNLGIVHRRAGRFSRALETWEQAWKLARDHSDQRLRALADRAMAESLELNTLFGRVEDLEALLNEIEDRELWGAAWAKASQAREGLWILQNRHEEALPSGPTALDRILVRTPPGYRSHPAIAAFHATVDGANLAQLEALAGRVGLDVRMAFRQPGAALTLPAVVHWKVGHYSALVRRQKDRYLVVDPMLGEETWMSQGAVDDESSGYFLVPGSLEPGWRAVSETEAASVGGRCGPPQPSPENTKPCDTKSGGGCGPQTPMAQWAVHHNTVNLTVTDAPVGYAPPFGPPVYFGVTYNHREAFQPSIFSYSNLGPRWTSEWLTYIEDAPAAPTQAVGRYIGGGGLERYLHTGSAFARHPESHTLLNRVATSPVRYELRYPDGGVDVFGQPDGGGGASRKVFLTERIDPQGNRVRLTYDAQLRLVALQDALGQVTTVSYQHPSDPLKVTKVTDPFGRFATFEYDGAGRLAKITDVIGITSQFTYASGGSGAGLMSSMTTPYGTTRFDIRQSSADREILITDPLGGQELYRYAYSSSPPGSDPPASVPAGMSISNSELNVRNLLYFDKRAMAEAPGNYDRAHRTTWASVPGRVAPIPRAAKRPLEGRVWYQYPPLEAPYTGWLGMDPIAVGRVLDDGTSQVHRYEYNSIGRVARAVDPLGRETVFEYDTNDIDLLRVTQKNGAGYDRLASFTYNTQHLPLTMTDASGQTTTLTYNARGQILTATNAKQETWTLVYDTSGYLQTITGPVTGATISFTYDGYGRIRTVTNMDAYTITVDYDLLDRPLRITYPNGTYEEVVYDRLHPERYRNLRGGWSRFFVDALQRPTAIRDPMGRAITLEWCDCGSLDAFVDGNGHTTRWERDGQGRLVRQIQADQSAMRWVYESRTSRLRQLVDAKGQIRNHEYFLDDQPKRLSYSNSPVPTPDVSFTYDPDYGRLATRTDGPGTTVYAYSPIDSPPSLGAGALASIDGPLTNDLVTYTYDEVGRVQSRGVNGAIVAVVYDALGRVTNVTNALGSFIYGYDGMTSRVASVTGPNGLLRTYSYFDEAGDRQLREIRNQVGTTPISRFTYGYAPDNIITSWTQQAGTGPTRRNEFTYDAADQLTSAVVKDDASGAILKRYGYAYDRSYNRTSEQIDDVLTTSSHNAVDALISRQGGGALRFAGSTNEPATVTVQGRPASTSATSEFNGTAIVTPGVNLVAVAATDSNGNTRTDTYSVSVAGGPAASLSYDANGNLTADGTRTYEWNALDRLTAVNQGTRRTEFDHDGFGRTTRMIEKDNGTVMSDRRFLWVGTAMVEERDAGGGTTSKRFLGQGIQQGTTALFYAKDHLGSTRELLDESGVVRARYDQEPYGRAVKTSGDLDADLGFTGHYRHAATGLSLAMYRGYDPDLGRWLSQDPIGIAGGINLYHYAGNNPVNFVDPLGLSWTTFGEGLLQGLVIGAGIAAIAALAPFGAAIALGIGLGGLLVTGLTLLWFDLCDDDIHRMIGGAVGGAIGGGAVGGALGPKALPGKANIQGPIVGWGRGQPAAGETATLAENLSPSQVAGMVKNGLNKAWVQDQLAQYQAALNNPAKQGNTQLVPRMQLMQQILNMWPVNPAVPGGGGGAGAGAGATSMQRDCTW